MKLMLLFLLLQIITLYANENWISIEPLDKTPTSKTPNKLDLNLSQIEPINKMIKNATVLKQLIDLTTKKELPATNDKEWFILNSETSK
ncbi:MAG: hypothetical protein RBS11_07335 [Sulfurimonas sp.]|jgi:hypothetical protein|nr:hypothetical protein [Sulfurimonas sp.]